MKLGDIGVLAEAIEKAIPEIAKNNGGEDIRHRLVINVNVTNEEIDYINEELYEMTNHKTTDSLEPVGTIDLELVGIRFLISGEDLEK